MTHESVADAAVIGVADEEAGELPKAYIVPKPGKTIVPEDMIDWVKGDKFSSADVLLSKAYLIYQVKVMMRLRSCLFY